VGKDKLITPKNHLPLNTDTKRVL